MARTPNLNDTQRILLTTAARRPNGSLMPQPDTLGRQTTRIRKAISTLIKRALAEEVDVTDLDRSWREEGDRRIGLTITAAGRANIGADERSAPADIAPAELVATPAATLSPPVSKIAQVITLLERGATLADMIEATGWLPHTTRAALTGLRKKGHEIGKVSRDGVTVYSIAKAA